MIDTKALRNKILDLAISGKLTEQIPEDGNAEDLYTQIQEEKAKLIAEGKIKKEKPLPPIKDDEIPFEIPENWKWVRLADVFMINPKVAGNPHDKAAFIPMEMINPGYESSFNYDIQDWIAASKNHTKFEDNDVAFAKISPCFENRKSFIAVNLPNGIGGGTTELIVLRQKLINPRYTFLLVLDERFIKTGSSTYKGVVGQQRIKTDVINNYCIPLPPLTEQNRIVSAVENAFAVIDKIEKAQDSYYADQEVLKNKIIDAGIRGKLTEQLSEDGSAEDLYVQIQDEKAKLIDEGKIKKEKPLLPISEEEIPFEIPENWKWVRFGDIMWNRDSERIPVSVADRKKLKKTYDYYGASGVIDKVESYLFDEKLLLIGEDGANLLSRSTPIAFIAKGKYWVNNHAHVLGSFCYDYLDFVMMYINSISLVPFVTGTAQPKLNQENMNKIPVPIPPFKEQVRIIRLISMLERIIV